MEQTSNVEEIAYLRQNESPKIFIINIIFLIIAIIAVILRLISRRLSAAHFWWDDGLSVVGLFLNFGSSAFNFAAAHNGAGKHHEVVPADQQVTLAKVIYGIEILYGPLLTAIKISILLLYLRLFGIRRTFRIIVYVLEALVICWCISILFVSIFQSSPIKYLWTPDLTNAHHINFTAYLVGLAVPNVVMDFAILVLPLSIVWQLQISRKRKVALSAIFLVGTFVCVISIVRTYQVAIVNNTDKTYAYASTLIWSAVEANVGITCSCLPILQPIVQKLVGRFTSSYHSRYGKEKPRALRAADTSHDTFESSNRPFRKLDEDVVKVPPNALPTNDIWGSGGQDKGSRGYQEDNDETSDIPMNAIRVMHNVDLEHSGQA